MTKSIIELADAYAVATYKSGDPDSEQASHERTKLLGAVAAIKAAHLEELAGVEMPEPVAECIHSDKRGYFQMAKVGRLVLDEEDKEIGFSVVKFVTLDQCREAVAAAVAKQREIRQRMEDEYLKVAQQDDEVRAALTAERDALAVDLAKSQDYAKSEYLLREKAEAERDRLREPLTTVQITEGCRSLGIGSYQTLAAAFKVGIEFAEKHHNIGAKEQCQ